MLTKMILSTICKIMAKIKIEKNKKCLYDITAYDKRLNT